MADILVVEDEQLIARLLQETLQSEGYNVVTAVNGEDAVQFALGETPHLVILDLMLPGIDGYEVVRRLHTYPKTIHIPIIVLSSLGEPKDKVRAFEYGVDDYVCKPFHTDELLARVHAQLRRVQQNFLSPLIGLPGGFQVELAIQYKLNSMEPWSLLYLDLDSFKAFNDTYGFITGNDMIRLMWRICQPHSIQEVSYLAAEAKNHAKQSTDNVYHMPPRRVLAGHDGSTYVPSRYVASSPFPPTLEQITQGHAHHYPLFGSSEENILK